MFWVISTCYVWRNNNRAVTVHGIHGYNCQIVCAQFLFAEILFMYDKHQVKGDLFLIPKLNKEIKMEQKRSYFFVPYYVFKRRSCTTCYFRFVFLATYKCHIDFKEESCLKHLKIIFLHLPCETLLTKTLLSGEFPSKDKICQHVWSGITNFYRCFLLWSFKGSKSDHKPRQLGTNCWLVVVVYVYALRLTYTDSLTTL